MLGRYTKMMPLKRTQPTMLLPYGTEGPMISTFLVPQQFATYNLR